MSNVLAERVPPEVILLDKLLDMLRGRTASTGLEESAAREERHDGEHLRTDGGGGGGGGGEKSGVSVDGKSGVGNYARGGRWSASAAHGGGGRTERE